MSSAEDYAYLLRMIIPDKTPEELEGIRDEISEKSSEGSTPMTVSTIHDYLTITLEESTEFPDERLSYAVMLAKSALGECGVERPVIVWAVATPTNNDSLRDIHQQILKDQRKDTTDMTDLLMHNELQ